MDDLLRVCRPVGPRSHRPWALALHGTWTIFCEYAAPSDLARTAPGPSPCMAHGRSSASMPPRRTSLAPPLGPRLVWHMDDLLRVCRPVGPRSHRPWALALYGTW